MLTVFTWSVWNGANYYMDVFGKKFQNELEQMKRDVAKWQNSQNGGSMASTTLAADPEPESKVQKGLESIPLLQDECTGSKSTGAEIAEDGSPNLTARK